MSNAETAAEPPRSVVRRVLEQWRRARSARGEIAWVLLPKLIDFPLYFLLVKVQTSYLTLDQFGESALLATGMVLLANLILMPANRAFQRYFHRAAEVGEAEPAAAFIVRWYIVAFACIVGLCVVTSWLFSSRLGLESGSLPAAGITFAAFYWRFLAVEVMSLRRDRRAVAIHTAAYLALSILLSAAVFELGWRSAASALIAQAIAAALLAAAGLPALMSQAARGFRQLDGTPLRSMVFTFGFPAAAVLTAQWVQNFSDRFIVAAVLDLSQAAIYSAAYVVSGIPFQLMLTSLETLLVPIAYQRARDTGDARQLWAADRLLLLGASVYVVVGLITVGLLTLAGPMLLQLMTTKEFVIPGTAIGLLAAARFFQNFAAFLQFVFAVHEQLGASLRLRLIAATMTVPACWLGATWAGVIGAVIGTFLPSLAYAGLIIWGPAGCWKLLRDAHRAASVGPTAGSSQSAETAGHATGA